MKALEQTLNKGGGDGDLSEDEILGGDSKLHRTQVKWDQVTEKFKKPHKLMKEV